MQVLTVNNVRRIHNSENAIGVLFALAILEYHSLGMAGEQILKSEDVPTLQEKDVSGIADAGKIGDLFRAITKNAPKSENDKKLLIWGGGVREDREKGLEE